MGVTYPAPEAQLSRVVLLGFDYDGEAGQLDNDLTVLLDDRNIAFVLGRRWLELDHFSRVFCFTF